LKTFFSPNYSRCGSFPLVAGYINIFTVATYRKLERMSLPRTSILVQYFFEWCLKLLELGSIVKVGSTPCQQILD